MNDNIENALSTIANYAKQCLSENDISRCIAIVYCYNSVAIECELDTRMLLHFPIEKRSWAIEIVSRSEYYQRIGSE